MDIVMEILLKAIDVMTLVIGISGVSVSILLMFFPEGAKRVSEKLSASLQPIRFSAILDRRVETGKVAYRYPVLSGILLTGGSVFVLNFLYFRFNPSDFSDLLDNILVLTLVGVGKAACICGLFLGLALVFYPERVKKIETRLGRWIDTEAALHRLDVSHPFFDNLLFRHPMISGSVGLLASFVLVILSAANLLRS